MPPRRSSSGNGPSPLVLTIAAVLLVGLGAVIARFARVAVTPAADAPRRESAAITRPAPEPSPQPEDHLVERAIASTVVIRCGTTLGAGFFVEPDRILTNKHVTCGDEQFEVELADGRRVQAELQADHSVVDLRTLQPRGLEGSPLPLGDVGGLRVGDRVLVLGNPLGLDFTVHDALVSALPRAMGGIPYVQLAVSVSPGNSGGPVVDQHGRVVGILTAKAAEAEGVALALPVNFAYEVDDALRLTDPPAGATSEAFVTYRAQARISEIGRQLELEEILLKPRLALAEYRGGRGSIRVNIVRAAPETPGTQAIGLLVSKSGNPYCELEANLERWTPMQVDKNSDLSRVPYRHPVVLGMARFLAETEAELSLYSGVAEVVSHYTCRLSGGSYEVGLKDRDQHDQPVPLTISR